MTAPTRPRSWRQTSLRMLFVLVTVAAIALGWLASERQKVQAKLAAIAAIEQEHGKGERVTRGNVRYDEKLPRAPKWLRLLTGDETTAEVWSVGLGGWSLTEQDLAPILHFPQLRSLNLMAVELDVGKLNLQPMQEIRFVEIMADHCDDSLLVALGNLSSLEALSIRGGQIRGEGLESLSRCKDLKYLQFQLPIENEYLVHLSKLKKLSSLDLCGSRVDDAGLDHIAQVSNLEYLRLNALQVSDRGLEKLVTLKHLKTLELRYCARVTDQGVATLVKISTLEQLELGPTLTDGCFESLKQLPALKKVDLFQTPISESAIEGFKLARPNVEVFEAHPPILPGTPEMEELLRK